MQQSSSTVRVRFGTYAERIRTVKNEREKDDKQQKSSEKKGYFRSIVHSGRRESNPHEIALNGF